MYLAGALPRATAPEALRARALRARVGGAELDAGVAHLPAAGEVLLEIGPARGRREAPNYQPRAVLGGPILEDSDASSVQAAALQRLEGRLRRLRGPHPHLADGVRQPRGRRHGLMEGLPEGLAGRRARALEGLPEGLARHRAGALEGLLEGLARRRVLALQLVRAVRKVAALALAAHAALQEEPAHALLPAEGAGAALRAGGGGLLRVEA